jgi:hypothetical protein
LRWRSGSRYLLGLYRAVGQLPASIHAAGRPIDEETAGRSSADAAPGLAIEVGFPAAGVRVVVRMVPVMRLLTLPFPGPGS